MPRRIQRCRALILRGIFLCRRPEVDWFLYGMRNIFPEAWRNFAGALPESERGDLLTAYYRRLTDPLPAVHMPAARAWSVYKGACSTLLPSGDAVSAFGEERMALGLARIEAHYFTHEILTGGTISLPASAAFAPSRRRSCRGATT